MELFLHNFSPFVIFFSGLSGHSGENATLFEGTKIVIDKMCQNTTWKMSDNVLIKKNYNDRKR